MKPLAAARRAVVALATSLAAEPLALRGALLFAAVLHGGCLTWGMPASDGWDVDGVAPRDVLPGLAETFTPGHYYTYPPLHLALLAVLTAPVTLAATLKAGTASVPAVIHEIVAPPYMTAIAMTARVVALVMSVATVWALAKIGEELAPPGKKRAVAVAVAVVTACDVPFTYYAHVTNLDVPYFFWASLAVLALVRAVARGEPARIRAFCIYGALAIATKDQAYAMFALAAPLALGLWALVDGVRRREIVKRSLIGGAITIALVLLVDGALFNPSGFRARLAFLGGSASQDFAQYTKDWLGRWLAIVATGQIFDRHYPWVIAGLGAVGLVLALLSTRGRERIAALVPLFVVVSFTLAFNVAARRVEDRFTLPQALMIAVYAGIGVERLWRARVPGKIAALAVVALTAKRALDVDVALFADPRYEAEAFVREHAKPGDVVEVQGLNVYLARPAMLAATGATVERVGFDPADRRNPMAGLTEVQGKLADVRARRPRFVVANECYFWRFIYRLPTVLPGHRAQTTEAAPEEADAEAYFRGLFDGSLGYRKVGDWRHDSKLFPYVSLHASVGCPMLVFQAGP